MDGEESRKGGRLLFCDLPGSHGQVNLSIPKTQSAVDHRARMRCFRREVLLSGLSRSPEPRLNTVPRRQTMVAVTSRQIRRTEFSGVTAGCGGDVDGLPPPAPNPRMKGVSGRLTVRRGAHGARKDFKPPQKSLTDPRDEGIVTLDTLGRSWEHVIWEMSHNCFYVRHL